MSNPTFSVVPKNGNPITTEILEDTCRDLGIQLKSHEQEDYRRLLAVFHDAADDLMAMEGMSCVIENNKNFHDARCIRIDRPLELLLIFHNSETKEIAVAFDIYGAT